MNYLSTFWECIDYLIPAASVVFEVVVGGREVSVMEAEAVYGLVLATVHV